MTKSKRGQKKEEKERQRGMWEVKEKGMPGFRGIEERGY